MTKKTTEWNHSKNEEQTVKHTHTHTHANTRHTSIFLFCIHAFVHFFCDCKTAVVLTSQKANLSLASLEIASKFVQLRLIKFKPKSTQISDLYKANRAALNSYPGVSVSREFLLHWYTSVIICTILHNTYYIPQTGNEHTHTHTQKFDERISSVNSGVIF